MTIIERLQQYKELEPHKIALIVDDIQYTYGELYDAILSVDINNTSELLQSLFFSLIPFWIKSLFIVR